jgi:hypothetical protein
MCTLDSFCFSITEGKPVEVGIKVDFPASGRLPAWDRITELEDANAGDRG